MSSTTLDGFGLFVEPRCLLLVSARQRCCQLCHLLALVRWSANEQAPRKTGPVLGFCCACRVATYLRSARVRRSGRRRSPWCSADSLHPCRIASTRTSRRPASGRERRPGSRFRSCSLKWWGGASEPAIVLLAAGEVGAVAPVDADEERVHQGQLIDVEGGVVLELLVHLPAQMSIWYQWSLTSSTRYQSTS